MALYSRSLRTKLTEFFSPLGMTEENKRLFTQEVIRSVLRLDTSKPQALRMVAHRLGIVDELSHFKHLYLDGSYYLDMELWIQVAKFFQDGTPMDAAVEADFHFMEDFFEEEDLVALAHVKTNDHLDLTASNAKAVARAAESAADLRIRSALYPDRAAPCINAKTWETGKTTRRNLTKYIQSKLKPVKFLMKYDPMWSKEDFEQDLTADLIKLGNVYRRSPQTKIKDTDLEKFVATEEFQRYAEVSMNLKLSGIQSYHTQEPRRRVKSTLDDYYSRRRALRKMGAETFKDPVVRQAYNEYLQLRKHLVNLVATVGPDGKVSVTADMPDEEVVGKVSKRTFAELYAVAGPQIEAQEAKEIMSMLCRRGIATPECGPGGRIYYKIAENISEKDKTKVENLLNAYAVEIEHKVIQAYIEVTPSDYFSQVVPLRHYGHEESESHEREFLDSDISSEAMGMYSVFDLDADRREAESELFIRDIVKKVATSVRENKIERKVLHFVRAVTASEDLDPALVAWAEERNRDLTNANVLIACAKQFYGIKQADLKNPYLTGLVAEHRKGKSSDRDADT